MCILKFKGAVHSLQITKATIFLIKGLVRFKDEK